MIFVPRTFARSKIRSFPYIDWFVFTAALFISLLGLLTMHSFTSENSFFDKQILWITIAVAVFFVATIPDYSFLRRTPVVVSLYVGIVALLTLIFLFGAVIKGSQNRFNLGLFSYSRQIQRSSS